ncbi:MAG TPA: hypothetical protein VH253_06500 [Phycisphaerae bacterium]|nr:hypothetical protein [Phycisphaerae bacterium]
MGVVIALTVLVGGSACGQTMPSSGPAASQGAGDSSLLEEARAKVKAGDDEGAVGLVRKYQAGLPVKGMNTDARWVNSNHMLAVAYMEEGAFAKANGPMEFVMHSGKGNRSTVLNSAMLDIELKSNSVRAVNTLRDFVASHEDDELAVDLLAAAIRTAGQNFPKADLSGARREYLAASAELEGMHPGEKRWGTQWVKADAFGKLEAKREQVQAELNEKGELLKQQTAELAALKQKYDTVTRPIIGLGRPSEAQQQAEAGDLAQQIEAKGRELGETQAAYEAAAKELPTPAWEVDLSPLAVEWVK